MILNNAKLAVAAIGCP